MIRRLSTCLVVLAALSVPGVAGAQDCSTISTLQWFSGGGQTVCPCFAAGEEAGAVFDAPAADYPLVITNVGIGWASQFGGTGQTLEQGINFYPAGLPDPGIKFATLPGPVLTDGAINEFDIQAQLGGVNVTSGPFTVTLEFAVGNAGDYFAPSIVHDGNGCTAGGKNVIRAIPGGWSDICTQGLGGDWVLYVKYHPVCQTGVGDRILISGNRPAVLLPAAPNPFRSATTLEFALAEAGPAAVNVYALTGRRVAALADREFAAGPHQLTWDGRTEDGSPAPAGIYFVELAAAGTRQTVKVLLNR